MFVQSLVSVYTIVLNPALPVVHRDIYRQNLEQNSSLGITVITVSQLPEPNNLASFLSQKSPQRRGEESSNHLIAMAQIFPPQVLIPCMASKTS